MIRVVDVIVFGAYFEAPHLVREHRDRGGHRTSGQIRNNQREKQGYEVRRDKSFEQGSHFLLTGLFAQEIRHGDVTDGHERTVMERQISNEVRLLLDLLVTERNTVVAEERFLHTHAAREDSDIEELRRRRRQQFAAEGIDVQILMHIDTQVAQVDGKAL